jgi:hypothetical protein
MAEPVTVVVSGGVPVVDATPLSGTALTNPTTYGVPVTPVESGARPVTIVASGAPPIVFIAENGVDYLLGGAGGSPPLVDLVLDMDPSWTTTDSTPDFVLDGDLAEGDELTYQTQPTGGDWSGATSTPHTVTGPEDLANTVAFALSALANATYDARVLSSRAGNPYGISNTETFTIAAVAADRRISLTGNVRISATGNTRVFA